MVEFVHDASWDLRKSVILRIKVSEQESAKADLQLALFSPLEHYLPIRQALGEEYLLVVPTQLAVFVHQACRHPRIAQLDFCGAVAPARVPVQFRRTTHPQRFVRALPVKLLSPQLQRFWRGSLTQAFQLFSDVPIKPFVHSVILRMRPVVLRSRSILKVTHHADKRLNPCKACTLAKGAPLSDRIASGKVSFKDPIKILTHHLAARIVQRCRSSR